MLHRPGRALNVYGRSKALEQAILGTVHGAALRDIAIIIERGLDFPDSSPMLLISY